MPAIVIDFDIKDVDKAIEALKKLGLTAEQAASKVEKAAEREGKARIKAMNEAAKAAKKAADSEAKDFEKAGDRITREINRQQKEAKKSQDQRARDAQRAAKEIENANKKTFASLGGGLGIRGAGGGIGTTLGYAIGGLIASAASAAVNAAINAVKANLKLNELANRVSITARKPGQGFVSPKEISDKVRDTAIEHAGVASEGLMGGLQNFVTGSGGNIELGQKLLGTMATTMGATGLGGEETGALMAKLGQEFHLETIEDYQKAIAQVDIAAKNSNQSFAELAQDFLSSGDMAEEFGLKLKDIAALASIAAKGGGSIKTMEKLLDKLETGKLGNITRDAVGHVRPIKDVLFDLIAKTGGTGPMIGKERALIKGIGTKGMASISPLLGAYKEAYEGAGGDRNAVEARKAAEIALTNALNQAFDSTSSFSEVEKDAAQSEQTASAQLQAAYEKLQKSVGDELTGPLTKLATAAGNAVPALAELVTALSGAIETLAAMLPGGESPVKKAEKALKKFDESDELWAAPGERDKLVKDVEDAKKQEAATFSEGAYASEFANLSGKTVNSKEWKEEFERGREDYQISNREALSGGGKISTTDKIINMLDVGSSGNYNPAQIALVKRMQENMGNTPPPGVIDTPIVTAKTGLKDSGVLGGLPIQPGAATPGEKIKPELNKIVGHGQAQVHVLHRVASTLDAIKADMANRSHPKD